MPHNGWNWGYVGCPYYLRDDPKHKTIDCMGFCAGAKKLTTTFHKYEDYDIQMEVFCKKYWEKCELYRMLDSVYDEDKEL